MTLRVLLVEDEAAIRDMLRFALPPSEYRIDEAANANEALAQLSNQPDIILLDWMLPGLSGIEILKLIRNKEASQKESIIRTPIIMLTAKNQEQDKIKGLTVGADDYITKPFSVRELKARMHALLRRSQTGQPTHLGKQASGNIKFKQLNLNPQTRQAHIDNVALKLGPTEFNLLLFFITHPERVYDRAQLLDLVWGEDADVQDRTVDVHIRRVRKILAAHDYDQYLRTVWTVGYRFSEKE